MITQTANAAAQIATDVAAAAAPALAPGSALNVGEAQTVPVELNLEYAVLCELGGNVAGELALFVEDSFARALTQAEVGELDLADALAPALSSIAAALGSIIVGEPTSVDARLAQSRIDAREDMAVVGLDDGSAIRAAVAVGLESVTAAPAPQPVRAAAGGQSERLDLLRNVEMAATVELGRTRMTINDLLSLRDGAVIELDRAAGDAADLFVNGRLIARGEIVVIGENYGLRVTQIVTDEPGR
ncbi:flagellar motor switch protein FliN/FliY [Jatrophihabitans endophyticus]|uniref:Flagellar motor switch protein FliN/FliY n=1 Tax=Jatrophihabitans endophyticus TaxID=1206085 RepID=A0A1M5IGS0_9ACTN|nr:flagellar motor switch protein FliN [Jatrophihabitans endophyticus]SHG27415.1 flagellar motor switch protein FliN/FliY [Jatrophihabitans endophyticus]